VSESLQLSVLVEFDDAAAAQAQASPCAPAAPETNRREVLGRAISNTAELDWRIAGLGTNQDRYLVIGRETDQRWVAPFPTYESMKAAVHERVARREVWAVDCYDLCGPAGPVVVGRVSAPRSSGWL